MAGIDEVQLRAEDEDEFGDIADGEPDIVLLSYGRIAEAGYVLQLSSYYYV